MVRSPPRRRMAGRQGFARFRFRRLATGRLLWRTLSAGASWRRAAVSSACVWLPPVAASAGAMSLEMTLAGGDFLKCLT